MSDDLTTITPEPAEPEPQGFAPTSDRPKRGGRRPGAGRPAGSTNRAGLSAKKAKPGRPSNHAQRAARVAALYDQIGSVMLFGAPFDSRFLTTGMAMTEHSAALGEAWASWADTSPKVAELLDRTSFGGAGVAVLIAHVPIVKAMMVPADGPAEGGALSVLDLLGKFASGDMAGLVDAATSEG